MEKNEKAYYIFTPTETGVYLFESAGECDTCVELYDSSMEFISNNDDGGSHSNFLLSFDAESGNTYYLVITTYEGDAAEFTVSLKKTPVASIVFTPASPIEITENTGGEWDYREDEDGNEVEYYYYSTDYLLYKDGNILTVNYTDGTTDNFVCNDGTFSNSKGDTVSLDYYISQYNTPWTIGSENYLTLSCLGRTTQVPVTILESPVASIVFTPASPIEITENTNGQWDYREDEDGNEVEYYYYTGDLLYEDGNTLKVTYTDGTTDNFVCNDYEFLNSKGDTVSLDYHSSQYNTPWTVGSENYFTVSYLGRTTQVPVTILENPVASIVFTPASPIEITENTGGEWDYRYDEDGNEVEFYYYAYNFLYKDGNTLKVTYTDGTTDNFVCNDGTFSNSKGDTVSLDYYISQYNTPWTVGSENYLTVSYLGCRTQIPVTIIAQEHTHAWNTGKITKPATETAEGEKTYTCTICGATKTEAIAKLTAQQSASSSQENTQQSDKTTSEQNAKNNNQTNNTQQSTNKTTSTVKKIKLSLKKVTVKKSAKKLVLQATLKINGKAAKGKKVTFKFNGKKYKVKTNKKGVAKVTIKKSALKKLKKGKKVTYSVTYGKKTVKRTVKVKK